MNPEFPELTQPDSGSFEAFEKAVKAKWPKVYLHRGDQGSRDLYEVYMMGLNAGVKISQNVVGKVSGLATEVETLRYENNWLKSQFQEAKTP